MRLIASVAAIYFIVGNAEAQALIATDAQSKPGVEPPSKPEPSQSAKPSPVKQALGDGTIGLLLQSWFTATDDSRFSVGSTSPSFSFSSDPGQYGLSTFRLRRAEISYDGKIANLVKYRVMIDPTQVWNGPIVISGTANTLTGAFRTTVTPRDILQDAWVGIGLPYTEVKVGQFKLPITMEGFGSSAKLEFAERAAVARIFGDQRDIGLMVSSDSKVPYFEYQAAVVNGRGKNVLATGPSKDVVGRLVGKPYKGISVGGSGYWGRIYDTSTQSYRQKNRAGAEVAIEMFGATLKGEYMVGRELLNGASGPYKTSPAGYYVTAGYRLYFFEELQVVGRYDHWDSDTATDKSQCAFATPTSPAGPLARDGRCSKYYSFSVGVNYDFLPEVLNSAKLQLDYYRDTDEVQSVSANEVFLVGQIKF